MNWSVVHTHAGNSFDLYFVDLELSFAGLAKTLPHLPFLLLTQRDNNRIFRYDYLTSLAFSPALRWLVCHINAEFRIGRFLSSALFYLRRFAGEWKSVFQA
jgi:hypothetical protein